MEELGNQGANDLIETIRNFEEYQVIFSFPSDQIFFFFFFLFSLLKFICLNRKKHNFKIVMKLH